MYYVLNVYDININHLITPKGENKRYFLNISPCHVDLGSISMGGEGRKSDTKIDE